MDNDFYIKTLREENENYKNETGRRKTALINTYGCQMNAHDSEKLAAMLTSMGYEVASGAAADIVIFNTCIIRQNAENRIIGNIGALKPLKDTNKNMIIAVCGCMPSGDMGAERLLGACRYVDVIFGTGNISAFPRLLYGRLKTGKAAVEVKNGPEPELPYIRSERFKASINIIYGCNNYCAYCVVPYVRGRERSRPYGDILDEAKALAADGVCEITLLGQNVNSYSGGITFAELLRKINGIDGIKRVRFMTSHPKDLSDEMIKAMAECENVCPHLHLPVQSGSTKVLKLMNRRYTKEGYLDIVRKVRQAIPGISLTTDIIVGFPGEDEQDFRQTLEVADIARFSAAYTFIYSKREGTPAAGLTPTADDAEINERFNRLVGKINDIALQINRGYIGSKAEVLIERVNSETGVLSGRTPGNTLAHIPAPALNDKKAHIGKTLNVIITGAKTFYLNGKLL